MDGKNRSCDENEERGLEDGQQSPSLESPGRLITKRLLSQYYSFHLVNDTLYIKNENGQFGYAPAKGRRKIRLGGTKKDVGSPIRIIVKVRRRKRPNITVHIRPLPGIGVAFIHGGAGQDSNILTFEPNTNHRVCLGDGTKSLGDWVLERPWEMTSVTTGGAVNSEREPLTTPLADSENTQPPKFSFRNDTGADTLRIRTCVTQRTTVRFYEIGSPDSSERVNDRTQSSDSSVGSSDGDADEQVASAVGLGIVSVPSNANISVEM